MNGACVCVDFRPSEDDGLNDSDVDTECKQIIFNCRRLQTKSETLDAEVKLLEAQLEELLAVKVEGDQALKSVQELTTTKLELRKQLAIDRSTMELQSYKYLY